MNSLRAVIRVQRSQDGKSRRNGPLTEKNGKVSVQDPLPRTGRRRRKVRKRSQVGVGMDRSARVKCKTLRVVQWTGYCAIYI